MSKIIQVTNIAPAASKEQMTTLFSYLGRIEEIQLYNSTLDAGGSPKICYVKYSDSVGVGIAQYLTKTVFLDRALVVVPYNSGEIPDEATAMVTVQQSNPLAAFNQNTSMVSQIQGVGSNQVIITCDPKLQALGLPDYPPLPACMDHMKVEEIRRTVYLGNIESVVTTEQILTFFSQFGEVKYVRLAGDPNMQTRSAYVEFTEQPSIISAIQHSGVNFHGRPISIGHSSNAIVKPEAKNEEGTHREVEEAMKRVKEAQSLISAAIEPELAKKNRSKSRSRSRSRRRSRSRSHRRSGSRSRHRSKSRSRSRRRRSRSPRRRSRSRSRDRRRRRTPSPRSRRRSRSRSPRSKSSKHSRRSRSRENSRNRKTKSDSKSSREEKDRKKSKTKEEVKVVEEVEVVEKKNDDIEIIPMAIEEKEPKKQEESVPESPKKTASSDNNEEDERPSPKPKKSKNRSRSPSSSVSPPRRKKSPSPRRKRKDRSSSRSKNKRRGRSRSRSRSRRRSRSFGRSRRSRSPKRRSRSPRRRRSRSPRRRSKSMSRSRSRTPKRSKHKKEKRRDKDKSRSEKSKKDKRRDKDSEGKSKASKITRDYDEEEKGYDSDGGKAKNSASKNDSSPMNIVKSSSESD